MIRDGRANVVKLSAFNHPNVKTGKAIIPGAVERPQIVRRINEWTRPLQAGDKQTGDDVYTVPDFLVGVVGENQAGIKFDPLPAGKRKIMNPAFSYMVLGRYPAQGANQLISSEWVYRARARWDAYVEMFGEVHSRKARSRPWASTSPRKGYRLQCRLSSLRRLCRRAEKWGGVDVLVSGDKGAKIYRQHDCEVAYT
jgi:hypothetical protein